VVCHVTKSLTCVRICINCLTCNDFNVFADCECNHEHSFDASEKRHGDDADATSEHKVLHASSSTSNEMAVLLYRAKAAAAESEVLRLHTEAAQVEVNTMFWACYHSSIMLHFH
jgi:hypothetical protein